MLTNFGDQHQMNIPKLKTAIFIRWQLAGPSRAQMFSLAACSVLQCPNTAYFYFIFCWPCISLQILANNQLDALFHVFIYFMSLRVLRVTALIIRRSNCIIHHLVWLVCVSDCLVCRSGGNCSSLLTGILSSHLHRLIILDDVLIQFDLLMMSAVMLETRRDMK